MLKHHNRSHGAMGVAIIVVLGIMLALHLLLPEATLWPFGLIALVVVTMLAAHLHKNDRPQRHSAES
jgi:hypothetical protein